MTDLLSKDHRILEKPHLDHRPFGMDASGRMIRDASGVKIRAYVDYLEDVVASEKGPDAGARALDELARLLNERIHDPTYHVTPAFLKNVWNSYSYEFLCFLGEFCKVITNDPQFPYKVGKEKLISPIIQTLGRPFSLSQIYSMFPHFGEKFAKGSLLFEVGTVTDHTAVLRMKCTDEVHRQFGRYRYACAELVCQSSKGGLAAVPERVHGLPAATLTDLSCMANGDEYCEWNVTWTPQPRGRWLQPALGLLAGGAVLTILRIRYPEMRFAEALILALFPAVVAWMTAGFRAWRADVDAREQIIQEQLRFVEARHEELRDAYVEQQRTTVELRRKISQLTTLHDAGLIFSSTIDRESLIKAVMQAILKDLHYDRAMIAFYDADRQVERDARVFGVPDEIAALREGHDIPLTPDSLEGTVLLQGKPVLVGNLRAVWDRLNPLNRELAVATQATAVISVPLKVKDRVIGSLTVDRTKEESLTQEDLDIMVTVAGQVAIALDNADAYHQIETLNAGLEAKVRDRTAALELVNRALEAANARLREMDSMKSAFVSMVSHELRTPMTSIKGYVENLLDGLVGGLNDKQAHYLGRVKYNIERLTRMINDLLDLSRIEAGAVTVKIGPVSIPELVVDVVEGFHSMAKERALSLRCEVAEGLPMIQGDRDKLTQVLTNLIQNAMKFTPSGGEITVRSQMEGDKFVQVCVADTGCGIQPHELEKVFERFYRGDSTTAESPGAGLGLAITKSLVELHGGRIWVESVPDQGSRFFFTLPIHSAT